MNLQAVLVNLGIGAVAGWIAGVLMKGRGFGLGGNIVVGIVGAFVAGLLLPRIGINLGVGIAANLAHATLGALVVLFAVSVFKKS